MLRVNRESLRGAGEARPATSEALESWRANEPYGLLSSSSHMALSGVWQLPRDVRWYSRKGSGRKRLHAGARVVMAVLLVLNEASGTRAAGAMTKGGSQLPSHSHRYDNGQTSHQTSSTLYKLF
jgi:hypothetical protein